MSPLLSISILIRLLATGWAVLLLWRQRNWRLAFLPLLMVLMALQPMLPGLDKTESFMLQVSILTIIVSTMVYFFLRHSLRRWATILLRVMLISITLYQIISLLSDDAFNSSVLLRSELSLSLIVYLNIVLLGRILTERQAVINYLFLIQTQTTSLANANRLAGKLREANQVLQMGIAERKRTQEKLKRTAAELARSNAELTQFAYVASHDLQEPLRKIQAFGGRLATKFGDALSDEGKDYLQRMQNASARMQTLINDLLSFSRVTSRADPFIPVDLTRVVKEVLVDLEIRIEEVGAHVNVAALPTIDADPTQMRQLLQNLIGNALKFHRDSVAPEVKLYAHSLNGRQHLTKNSPTGESCQIIVEDNGIGFDQQYAERIFEVFQRLHGRSEYEGTGVGLAVCRKIVERHGGTITASSKSQPGATFIVTLPLKQPGVEHSP